MASKVFMSSLGLAYFLQKQRIATVNEMNEDTESSNPRKAICILHSQPGEVAKGVVYFS